MRRDRRPLDELVRSFPARIPTGRAGLPRPRPRRGLRAALGELWHILRLDEPDPVAAWDERIAGLKASAELLNARALRRARAPRPGNRAHGRAPPVLPLAGRRLRDRRRYPPSAEPADGGGLHGARSAARRRPRDLDEAARPQGRRDRHAGSACVSRGDGRSRSTPTRTSRRCRAKIEFDEGAARLGEVALVDRQGRIGPLGDGLLRHAARRERREPHRARERATRSPPTDEEDRLA